MVKCLWDEYIPHEFLRYIYNSENYIIISNPKLTYQKANEIVKNFINEDSNRINLLKYKIEEKLKLIHYMYSNVLLLSKIYSRTNNFGIQNNSNFDFHFASWRTKKKQNAPIVTTNQITTEVLSKPKNPKDYQDREVH